MIEEFLDSSGEMLGSTYCLRASLNSDLEPQALAEYCVRNLGFVCLRHRRSGTELRLRPSVVSGSALVGLLYWLNDHPKHGIALATLTDTWRLQVASNRDHLIAQLNSWLDAVESRPQGSAYLAVPNPSHRAAWSDRMNVFHRRTAACGSSDDLVALCRAYFDTRFTLATSCRDNGFLISAIGSGYAFVDRGWKRQAVGLNFEECPDPKYGRWVTQAMSRALRSGRPLFEAVDVMIGHPAEGRRRFRYDRMITALPVPGGDPILLSSSIPNLRIDLRVGH